MKFAAISEQTDDLDVAWMCRVLGVSRSGYYAWKSRPLSARAKSDLDLIPKIEAIFHRRRRAYGSPRIARELRDFGTRVSEGRVARLMSIRGLFARPTKRFRKTTDSKHDNPIAPNLLQRRFYAEQPNQAWVADITYVRTWNGWLYLAVILDLHSRRVVGWATAPHMRTKLVLDALQRAVRDRKPPAGMIHHSDRGSQYASADYRGFLRRHQVQCSMSRKGDCWDNAVAESFFSTPKTELIHRQSFPTRRAAAEAIRNYIEDFYNPIRKHSAVGYVSPIEYEMGVASAVANL